MPSQRGVSGFWLDIKALENHRTHLIAELGPKEGMLAYAAWVRIFTWQYNTANPIKDPAHLSRLTNLHIHKARLLWRLLPQLLPRSLIRSPHGLLCKRTMEILKNYNKNQDVGGAQSAPEIVGDSDSDSDSEEEERKEKQEKEKKDAALICPHQKIIDLYHEHTPCRRIRSWTGQRPGLLKTLWREHPELEWWAGFFRYVAKSDFLCGRAQPKNGSPVFMADLEWLIRPNNFQKINEGKYHHVRRTQPRTDIGAHVH